MTPIPIPNPGHDPPYPRPVADPTQLGALDRPLFSSRGYKVLAPPGRAWTADVEGPARDPSVDGRTRGRPRSSTTTTTIIRGLGKPPSSSATPSAAPFTQILLDRGLGAAGVAIDSAPVKGVLRLPFSTLEVAFPVLRNPANRHRTVALTPEQFHYAFTNTLSEEESRAAYDRYARPRPRPAAVPGRLANFNPHAATEGRLPQRRPRPRCC